MTKMRGALLALLIVGSAMGCTYAKISGRGTSPLILNNPTQRVTVLDHFKESKRIMFDYTNAFDVSEVIGGLVRTRSADAVTNLTITVKQGVGDFFINLFTLGIASAKTFVVEGDLVKMGAGTGSLNKIGEVFAESDSDGRLMARLSEFSGDPALSPVVVNTPNGFVLVRATH